MKERKSFLHRASQQSLSTSYEKEAADGLDYLGNEEEIENALNDLEKKLGISSSKNKNLTWMWVAASSVLVVSATVVWFSTRPVPAEIVAQTQQNSEEKKVQNQPKFGKDSSSAVPMKKIDPPKIASYEDDIVSTENTTFKEESPPTESVAMGQAPPSLGTQREMIGDADDQDKSMVASDVSMPKTLSAPRKIGKGTWEEQLLKCGIWDGKENLFPTRIPATVVDGKLKITRTNRFSESKWNSLDSLIQHYSENELRKGSIELLLPLR
jgi:hypothetical protein